MSHALLASVPSTSYTPDDFHGEVGLYVNFCDGSADALMDESGYASLGFACPSDEVSEIKATSPGMTNIFMRSVDSMRDRRGDVLDGDPVEKFRADTLDTVKSYDKGEPVGDCGRSTYGETNGSLIYRSQLGCPLPDLKLGA